MPRSRNTADLFTSGANSQLGFINGLTLARVSTTTYSVATGAARNEDAGTPALMALGTALTKSLSAWAAGNNNGSLDTGTITLNSWYHVHLIQNLSTGVVDVLLSLSATAPTMPSGYTARRRIGSIRTDASSQVTAFVQNGDKFLWDVAVSDLNVTNPGTTAATRTLTVPTGVVVFPSVSWGAVAAASTAMGVLVTPLSITDSTPSSTLTTVRAVVTSASGGTVQTVVSNIPTNTSAQVRTRCESSSASDVLRAVTHGWVDPRGRV